VDVNEDRFRKSILKLIDYIPEEIISKHKADDIFPIVSAASIIAKDKRDSIIEEIKKKFGDIGSGYPSDKKTIRFLRNWMKEKKNVPPFARKSWETTKKIFNEEVINRKISDFF
jgi:ribonuclease HII